MQVIKRDASLEDFNKQKIVIAIISAMEEGNGIKEDIAQKIADEIEEKYSKNNTQEIEINDIELDVFNALISHKQRLSARAYEGYRSIREFQRDIDNTTDGELLTLLSNKNDYWKTENSNKNATLVTTQRDYMAGIVSKDLSERFLLPPDVVQAHKEGVIHFHDIDYFAQSALHNCFDRNTKFITADGVKSFYDFENGDTTTVLTKSGEWKKAVVHNYGKDKLYEYTFYNGKKQHTQKVLATENHRWYLKDNSVTTNLKIGDKLFKAPSIYKQDIEYEKLSDNEKLMWCKGFALGDGTVEFNGANKHLNSTRIRLCGNKNDKWLDRFNINGCKIRKQKFKNGDHSVVVYNYHKEIPTFNSINEIKCFFNGLYCADGRISATKNGYINYRIQSSDKSVIDFIKKYAPVVGLYIIKENELTGEKTNFTTDNGRKYTILFSLNPNFSFNYTVLDKKFIKEDDVWCLSVEEEHNFVLSNGIVTGNCDLINLDDMLQNGTVINEVKIERPHKFLTACTIATQIITSVASSQYGGCSITLTALAPFVRDSYNIYYNKYLNRGINEEKSKEYAMQDLKKEIEDGVQTFNYQINSMSTTNGQAPFITVFMYLGETDEYKDELAMIIEEFLNQRIKGMKNRKGVYVTQAFPKLIYALEEDNITKDSKYWYLTELSAKCTAKRMVPDYISEKVMRKLKEGNCFPSMGCRSFLAPYNDTENIANAKNYKPGYKFYGRLNKGVVTINLPDVALSADGDIDTFWKIFDKRLELCRKALYCRYLKLKGTLSDVAPILWQDGALARLKPGETIDKLLVGGYSSISLGYAGLYECVTCLTHKPYLSEESKSLGLQIMQHMNDKCAEWDKTDNLGYSIYGSPIESTTYKFAKCLKKRFGNDVFIKIDGRDRDYITNSYHYPVFEPIDAFSKLKFESEFQALSTGGYFYIP